MVQLAILFCLIGIPLIEIALFVVIGGQIGLLGTLVVVILTGIAGTILLRLEGLRVLGQVQRELNENRMPATSLIGAMLLGIAGILLITPGFLTDAIGFLLFLPPVREMVARALITAFRSRIVVVGPDGRPRHPGHDRAGGPESAGPYRDDGFSGGPVIDEVAVEVDETPRQTKDESGRRDMSEAGEEGAGKDGGRSSPWRAGS